MNLTVSMGVSEKVKKEPEPGWSECHSFEEWVVEMLKAKKGKTPEFQAVVKFHGRTKIQEIWERHRKKK